MKRRSRCSRHPRPEGAASADRGEGLCAVLPQGAVAVQGAGLRMARPADVDGAHAYGDGAALLVRHLAAALRPRRLRPRARPHVRYPGAGRGAARRAVAYRRGCPTRGRCAGRPARDVPHRCDQADQPARLSRCLGREDLRAANVTKGSFYHHNAAKDDLVVECFARSFDAMRRVQSAALAEGGDSWHKISSAAATLVEFSCRSAGRCCAPRR